MFKKLKISPLFGLKHWKWLRLLILVSADITIIAGTYWLSYVIRLESPSLSGYLNLFVDTLPLVIGCFIFPFYFLGMYKQVWRYANFHSAILIAKCIAIGTLLFFTFSYLVEFERKVPRSIPIIHFLLSNILITLSKFSWRIWSTFKEKIKSKEVEKCLIFGAGAAGELFVRHSIADPNFPYKVIGFIDDDKNKKNRLIHGKKIFGSSRELEKLIEKYNIDLVVIAIHSAPGKVIRNLFDRCQNAGIRTLMMPDMASSLDQDITKLRPIKIEDLLRRSPQKVDQLLIENFFQNKTILVTGAGGSIGSELCRQIKILKPNKLIILDSSEFNLYKIENELLSSSFKSVGVFPILGSVTDSDFINNILKTYQPSVILHAAAYKHVPMVESNPIEGIINNVLGTKNLAEAAIKNNVKNFILISTDKAVNPTNIMGGTKRCCELLIQSLNEEYGNICKFSAVRFGNVLASSGSVVPKFLDQIKSGGPITVTHPDVTRYFMLVSEAVGLVLQSAAQAEGGEIFILDMGESIKIYEMAKQLVRLAGKEPGRDIEIEFVGLRPGEKLYEELIIKGSEKATSHKSVFIAQPASYNKKECLELIEQLIKYARNRDTQQAITLLKALSFENSSTSFKPKDEIKESHRVH